VGVAVLVEVALVEAVVPVAAVIMAVVDVL
jgi:hypothetical protein